MVEKRDSSLAERWVLPPPTGEEVFSSSVEEEPVVVGGKEEDFLGRDRVASTASPSAVSSAADTGSGDELDGVLVRRETSSLAGAGEVSSSPVEEEEERAEQALVVGEKEDAMIGDVRDEDRVASTASAASASAVSIRSSADPSSASVSSAADEGSADERILDGVVPDSSEFSSKDQNFSPSDLLPGVAGRAPAGQHPLRAGAPLKKFMPAVISPPKKKCLHDERRWLLLAVSTLMCILTITGIYLHAGPGSDLSGWTLGGRALGRKLAGAVPASENLKSSEVADTYVFAPLKTDNKPVLADAAPGPGALPPLLLKKREMLRLHQLTFDVVQLFEEKKIFHYLDSESLAGAVRQEGLIPSSHETVLSLDWTEKSKIGGIITELHSRGLGLSQIFDTSGWRIYRLDDAMMSTSVNLFFYDFAHSTPCPPPAKPGTLCALPEPCTIMVPGSCHAGPSRCLPGIDVGKNLQPYTIGDGGLTVSGPAAADEHLQRCLGTDWRKSFAPGFITGGATGTPLPEVMMDTAAQPASPLENLNTAEVAAFAKAAAAAIVKWRTTPPLTREDKIILARTWARLTKTQNEQWLTNQILAELKEPAVVGF